MISINKTIKLFIGGKFPRTESGRSFEILNIKDKSHYAHLSLASRKDFREAVEAATAGLNDWANRSAFNRSQILYRMAEMMEGKRSEFIETMTLTTSLPESKANEQVDLAIDALVYYAGFADKFQQVTATLNPINGPFGNVTAAEPVGVVTLVAESNLTLERLTAQIAAIITGGNSVIAMMPSNSEGVAMLAPLSEVFATSDLPGGVINLLSLELTEVAEFIGSHMDVRSIVFQNDNKEMLSKMKTLGAENMKRIITPKKEMKSLDRIIDTVEFKTIWQPIGF